MPPARPRRLSPAIRPATAGDLDAVRAIEAAHGGLRSWPDRPDFLDHELATGRMAVAEHRGEVVAFGGAFDRSGTTHLADLFVEPGLEGRGIGRAVLASLLDGEGERMTFASSDPRAAPLYGSFGMRPVMPLLYLEGERASALQVPEVGPIETAGERTVEVAGMDARASGRERPQDHAFLRAVGSAALVLADGPRPSGYAYVRVVRPSPGGEPEAFLGPIGGRDRAAAKRITLGAVRFAAEHAWRVHLALPEPHPALPALLQAGFRIEDRDTVMSSRADALDGRVYAPCPELG